jgi:hypothetical protein
MYTSVDGVEGTEGKGSVERSRIVISVHFLIMSQVKVFMYTYFEAGRPGLQILYGIV